MLDQLKNFSALPGLMARAKEMQEKMTSMQDELGKKHVSADAGAGMVSATVSGKLELISVRIDRKRLGVSDQSSNKTPLGDADIEMLEDLIVAAIGAAQAKAADLMRVEMGKLASDMGLPPGMLPGQ